MRFKAFKNKYWIFLKHKEALKNESQVEDCKVSRGAWTASVQMDYGTYSQNWMSYVTYS